MEDLLSIILQIDRGLLCSYLFKQELSNERFKLWENGLKPIVLNEHLQLLETKMYHRKCYPKPIICRLCKSLLHWTPRRNTETNEIDDIDFMCQLCSYAQPILHCNCEETCKILIYLLDKEHPQIIASALNLMFISGHILNSLSPPIDSDNPIQMILSMYQHSPSALKMGGTNAVIIADIYEDRNFLDFPILYVADTVAIPTRYYLHALKFAHTYSADQENQHNNQLHCTSKEEYLLNELMEIANSVIKSGSFLVLGPRLQQLISPNVYKKYRNNLSLVIPFDELKSLDGKTTNQFDVTDNFAKITKPCVKMCRIVYEMMVKLNKTKLSSEYYDDLQKYLTAAVWLNIFSNTPFESLLYHVLDKKL